MFTINGTLKVVNPTQKISEKFQKREFVVTDTSSQYPQDILFQLTQDRVTNLDGFKEGDDVTVNFFIRGREWTSPDGTVKYFNSLDVWKIEGFSAQSAGQPSAEPTSKDDAETFVEESEDDLPF